MPPLSSTHAQLLPASRRRQRRKRQYFTMALEQLTPEQIMLPSTASRLLLLRPQFEPPSCSAADNYNSLFIVRALSDVLERTCERNASCTLHPNPHIDARTTSMFYSCTVAPFSLSCYVFQLVTRLQLSRSVYIVALVFLDRVRLVDQRLCLIHLNVHRVLATALCVADKYLEDECHRNSTFCTIAGIPSLAELNSMEHEFLRRLQWNCWVSAETFEEYDTAVFSANADERVVDAQAAVALESAAVMAARTLSMMTSATATTTSHV
ncbi:unnamed protein product [Agarophyton chilense]